MTAKKEKQIKEKEKALKYFKKQVLNSAQKKDIVKMYLFGSMLNKKRIREDSDIDVLIFRRGRNKRLENIIDETSFNTIMRHQESVEPLIYYLKDYYHPQSAFLKRVIRDGKELYSAI